MKTLRFIVKTLSSPDSGISRAPGKRLGVESSPIQEPLCFLICLTSQLQAGQRSPR